MKRLKNPLKTWPQKKSVFIRYFIIHLLLFSSLILLTNYVIYNQVTSYMKKNVHDAQIDLLHQYKDSMTNITRETEQLIEQLAFNRDVLLFVEQEQSEEEMAYLKSHLRNMVEANDNVISIYLYSGEHHSVIASNQQEYFEENFYDTEWLTHYNDKLVGTHIMETRPIDDGYGNDFDVMTFIHSVPYRGLDRNGAIIVNINTDRVYKRLVGTSHEVEGAFYVLNREGQILLHDNPNMLYQRILSSEEEANILPGNNDSFTESTEKRNQLYTSVKSHSNQWNYVYEISTDALNSILSNVTGFILLITLLAIILSLLLAYMVSRYMSNPVRKLVQLVPPVSEGEYDNKKYRDEFHYLDEVYHALSKDNEQLKERITNIRPAIKERLIDKLLTTNKVSKEELYEKLELLNIHFSKGHFIVITTQIDDYYTFAKKRTELEMNIYKMGLALYLEEYLSSQYQVMVGEIEIDKLSVIIHDAGELSDFDLKDKLVYLMKELQAEVSKQFPFTVTLGMGRPYDNLLDIHQSYQESLQAIKYKFYQGKDQFINVDEIEMKDEELYFYKVKNVKNLLSKIKAADDEQVKAEVDQLFDDIMKSGHFPYEQIQPIIIQLISAIIELVIENGIEMKEVFGEDYHIYEEFKQKQTIYDMKDFLTGISVKVMKHIEKVTAEKLPSQTKKILDFIDSRFDQDISLQEVSDWIGLSTTYTSKMVKEATGQSYVEYVNAKRIERAKQLLESTQLTIKEIGFRVGFNNIQTFLRVFKKSESMTPGQFREQT